MERPATRTKAESLLALTTGIVVLLVLLLAGALYGLYLNSTSGGRADGPWPVTGISFRPLVEETHRALGSIANARGSLPDDLRAAESDLERSAAALRRLRDYYLPLVDAREHAYGARFRQLGGAARRASRELASVRQILLAMSEGDEHVARELRRPLSTLTAAESEVANGRPRAAHQIAQLGREINLLILKGDLALSGSRLENR